jgi:DNA-binding MurR/RpiR family transcriptional regulator
MEDVDQAVGRYPPQPMTPKRAALPGVGASSSRPTPGPNRHSLDERIAAADELAPSERAVVRFIVEHRDEVLFMSAGEIAAASNVGSATVVRTAQRLGYKGLPDLKGELRDGLRTRATIAGIDPTGTGEANPAEPSALERVIGAQIETLAQMRGTLNREDFGRAVELLAGAERIGILIGGMYAGLGQYLGRALRRAGRRVVLLDTVEVSESWDGLGERDALVMFAYDEIEWRLTSTLDLARDSRLPVVLITDTFSLVLEGRYAVAIRTTPGAILAFPYAVSTLAVVEGLLVGLRDKGRRGRPAREPSAASR